MATTLNGRRIVNIEVDGINTHDYPDFVDAFISYAEYEDTGTEVSDEDYEELNNNSGLVYDKVMERLF
jgi:hypothetical protein